MATQTGFGFEAGTGFSFGGQSGFDWNHGESDFEWAQREAQRLKQEQERQQRAREERERKAREEQQRRTHSHSDPWEVLGVSHSASKAEIRAAWTRLCREHHPDGGGDVRKMQAVNAAYNRLKGGR